MSTSHNCMQYIDEFFFPTMDHQDINVQEEEKVTQHMKTYLSQSPEKGRWVDGWVWNAPKMIKRGSDEPGYAFAYKDKGMGHWEILYWNHNTGEWHKQLMGGENTWSATKRYKEWVAKGFTAAPANIVLPVSLNF